MSKVVLALFLAVMMIAFSARMANAQNNDGNDGNDTGKEVSKRIEVRCDDGTVRSVEWRCKPGQHVMRIEVDGSCRNTAFATEIECYDDADDATPTPAPPMLKVSVGLEGGVLGFGRGSRTGFGVVDLGVELRLSPVVGVLIDGTFGGSAGLIEGDANTLWGTGIGLAIWPTDTVRLALSAGYPGVRNASWEFSSGGPQGSFGADFLLGGTGFALGVKMAAGPSWDYDGNLNVGWSASVGLGYFFGGPRQ